MSDATGWLSEVFASWQGEGTWLGHRQIFARLAGCRRDCAYCDTRPARAHRPASWLLKAATPALRAGVQANPVQPVRIAELLAALDRSQGPFHSVAFTGGEPLEQAGFLRAAARKLKRLRPRLKIMLETNALEAEALADVLPAVDFIAADFKLASATGLRGTAARHDRFLTAAARKPGCVKTVITPSSTPAEIRAAARLARRRVPDWEFVLQPAAGYAWRQGKPAAVLETLARAAAGLHPNVRVIPQIHRLMGID